jgi:imidazolonepropionase-like amidohydrolase
MWPLRLPSVSALPVLLVPVLLLTGCVEAPEPEAPPEALVPDAPPPDRVPLAIVDVTVLPMDREEALPGQTVIIRDGRIAEVGPVDEVEVPEDALPIEGAGRYLIPGLAEMHGHLPGAGADPEAVRDLLFLYVANGVTLVRGMQGHPAQIAVREAIRDGELLGPRLVLGSPAMGWGNVPSLEEVPARIRGFRDQDVDLVKIGEGASPQVYDALVAAAREAGLPVAGHVPDEVGLLAALEAGQVTIDHLDNYVEELVPEDDRRGIAPLWGVASVAHLADEGRIPELVEATRAAGTAQVPTMVLWEVFFGDRSGAQVLADRPEARYMPEEMVEGWVRAVDQRLEQVGHAEGARRTVELRRQVFQALHEGGVEFLLGTDSPQLFSVPGFSLHREMELWVELGMTPYEVLRTGSWNVAAHFGELEEAGSVSPGKRADLLLLEGNPLEDIGHVARRAGVVVDGRWLPEEEIQARLEEIAGS